MRDSRFGVAVYLLLVLILGGNIFMLWRLESTLASRQDGRDKSASAVKAMAKPDWSLTVVTDSTCKDCSQLDEILKFIKDSPVNVVAEKNFDLAKDPKATQAAIDLYHLDKLPALVISGPAPSEPELSKFYTTFGGVVSGKGISGQVWLLTKIQPPYKEVKTGQVRGLFSVTYLSDRTCVNCYDVKKHQNAFTHISMTPSSEKFLDVSDPDGQVLVKKYKITQVPTIVVTGDLGEYQGFQDIWSGVGTHEADGAYVFRVGIKDMGTYRDLKSGKVIAGK
ncbi:hypothetical protein HY224_02955 [Candidatus Uhrbacteria bacterium]|nr:hypothetical protein [Candidatus Uhrbacteria bacterium]